LLVLTREKIQWPNKNQTLANTLFFFYRKSAKTSKTTGQNWPLLKNWEQPVLLVFASFQRKPLVF
jgi:hypothetical protein